MKRSFIALVFLPFLASIALAEPGVSSDRVVFGQAAPLDGPAAELGKGMRLGIQAAFNEANAKGGVHGRKLELVSRDDGYEPTKSIDAVKALIAEDKIFAMVGPVGTPTSVATQPIAQEAGLPFIGPFTGSMALRAADKTNVINLRASYDQETEVMVERLATDLGIKKIAIFYQDDAYGRAGLSGLQKALAKRGMSLAGEATYERNTIAVKSAVIALKKVDPEVIVIIGAYKPVAEFIKTAKQVRLAAKMINISFVGGDALASELGEAGQGVIVTQVVPFWGDDSVPLVKSYRAALKAMAGDSQPGFVSLEGYAVGRLLVAALEKIAGEPTRAGLLQAMQAEFDLGGMKLSFKAGDNQGSNSVYLTVIGAEGAFKQVDKLEK